MIFDIQISFGEQLYICSGVYYQDDFKSVQNLSFYGPKDKFLLIMFHKTLVWSLWYDPTLTYLNEPAAAAWEHNDNAQTRKLYWASQKSLYSFLTALKSWFKRNWIFLLQLLLMQLMKF